MNKPNRNAPCWCGSGKKYKNCHLREDDAKAQQAALAKQAATEPRKRTPEQLEADARWDAFEKANLDDKVALFLDTLAAGKLDAEESYEMLSAIRDASDTRQDAAARARYAELVERLRHDAPDLYHHDLTYYHQNLITDAIAAGRWDALPELVAPLSEVAEKHIDTFFDIIDLLLYHGKTELLLDAMSRAWKKVSTSGNIMPDGVDEYIGVLSNLILYRYLETTPAPRADDPALHDAFKPYGKYIPEWLARAVPRLSAAASSSWQPADFGEGVDAQQWENNVIALMFEFMADQRRRANVPFSKSNMAQFLLYDVLHQQFSEPTPPRSKKSRAPKSPLVPRRAILDRTLAQKFHLLGSQPHKAGAAMELVPAYLHFLARVGAIHPIEMDEALAEIRPLSSQVCGILDKFSDARLVQNVATAWSDATLQALRDDPVLAAARAKPIQTARPPLPTPAARPGALQTYTFLVTYLAKPSIKRKIEIAADQTLDDLHHAIQSAVNFDEDHLYSFYMSGKAWDETTEYSAPQGEGRSAASVKIRDLGLRMKQRFLYLFDYGDQHEFGVQLEAINLDAPKGHYPKVVWQHGRNPKQYRDWD